MGNNYIYIGSDPISYAILGTGGNTTVRAVIILNMLS